MEKITILSVLLIVSCIEGQANQSASNADCKITETCESLDWRITDPMVGTIDGKNSVFNLSRTPMQGAPVAIFKNGLPLRDDVDFKILGRQVVMIGEGIPLPGDVLRALYKLAPRALSPSPRNRSITPPPDHSKGGDFSAIAMRDALTKEVSGIGRLRDSTSEKSEVQSLRMLRKFPSEAGNRSDKAINSFSGVDGLGDKPRSVTGSSAKSADDTRGGYDTLPSSLRMLQERIHDDGDSATPSTKPNRAKAQKQRED